MIPVKVAILLLLAFLVICFLQWKCNLPRKSRYQQFWSPILALIYVIGILYLQSAYHSSVIDKTVQIMMQYIQQWLPGWQELIASLGIVLLNGIILISFISLKITGLALNFTLIWLRGFRKLAAKISSILALFKINPKKVWGRKAKAGEPHSVSLVYCYVPGREVYLKPEWIYPAVFFAWAVVIPLVMLAVWLLSFAVPVLNTISKVLPALPVLPFILLTEIALFLGGEQRQDLDYDISGEKARARNIGQYRKLWEEYQEIWPERVLTAKVIERDGSAIPEKNPLSCDGADSMKSCCDWLRRNAEIKRDYNIDCHVYCTALDSLSKGHSILLSDAAHCDAAPFIFTAIIDCLIDGKKVLVVLKEHEDIEVTVEWITEGINQCCGLESIWKITSYDLYLKTKQEPDILVVAMDGAWRYNEWFKLDQLWTKKLNVVMIPEGFGLTADQTLAMQSLMRSIKDLSDAQIQYIVFSKAYQGREPWLRESLKTSITEFYAGLPSSPCLFYIVWRSEGQADFQTRILPQLTRLFAGEEIILGLPAIRAGIQKVCLVRQQGQPWDEYIEELRNERWALNSFGLNQGQSAAIDRYYINYDKTWMLPVENSSFIIIRDNDFNLIKTLQDCWARGRESCFVHIISPPYMLRDYMAANVDFFLQADHYLSSWAPAVPESDIAKALLLWKRLEATFVSEGELNELISSSINNAYSTKELLINLFRKVFGNEIDYANYLKIRISNAFDSKRGQFMDMVEYSLLGTGRLDILPEWVRIFKIIDEAERIVHEIPAGLVYQTYLPGQLHAFNGKLYRIVGIDNYKGIIRISFVDPSVSNRPMTYRSARQYLVTRLDREVKNKGLVTHNVGILKLSSCILPADFSREIQGYTSFAGEINLTHKQYTYTDLSASFIPARNYTDRNILEIIIEHTSGDIIDPKGELAFTLGLLLNELFLTLFPNSHHLLAAAGLLSPDFMNGMDEFGSRLMLVKPGIVFKDQEWDGRQLRIYILEDSPAELGILETISHRWTDIMLILEDYLTWLGEDPFLENSTEDRANEKIGIKSEFLAYGRGEVIAEMDLLSVRNLLRELLPSRDLIAFRHKDLLDGKIPEAEKMEMRHCDFCGTEYPAAQAEQLGDGRERCLQCRNTAVNTMEQLVPLFDRARAYFYNYGLNLRKEISVNFVSSQEIHRLVRLPFITTPETDGRLVGLATEEKTGKGKKVSIYIENGAPARMTLSTLVHELTHIWQYDNLDVQAMSLLEIEGLASWVEIAFLNEVNEKEYAERCRQQLMHRNDEYGNGYRLISEILKNNPELKSPFEHFLLVYPVRLYE